MQDPGDLTHLFQYQVDPNNFFPFVALNTILAPMHESYDSTLTSPSDFPYVQDSGLKNPFLAIQYGNQTSPLGLPSDRPRRHR